MTRTTMHPFKMLAAVGAVFLVWGLLFAYASSPAWAATITVNSLADDADGADGECTLREAITAANTDMASGAAAGECEVGSGDDEIHFALPGTAPWTVNLTGELPDLSTNLEIHGPGADQFTVRRDGGGEYRIFTVFSATTDVDVSISGMTITGGNTREYGGGIFSDAERESETTATTTIANTTISGNTGSRGGGVATRQHSTVKITGSTISGNTALDAGGGVYSDTNLEGKTTTIRNSTISGNTAPTYVGAGVYNFGGLTVIESSTITDNTARRDGDGSGVYSYPDDSTRTEVLSSIISANQGTDVDSGAFANSFTSNGFNLIGDGNATKAFNQAGDRTGVGDPGLDPLGAYGGPTQTHRLQSDSPTVDEGPPPTSCPPPGTDQRGVDRPQDGNDDGTANCDIGSFELEEPPNAAPGVTVAQGGSCGTDQRSGTLRLRVSDVDDPSSGLSLSATSSNRVLLPRANISFGGTGGNRTMTLRPLDGKSGTAFVRITVGDGSLTSTRILTVKVGTNAVDAINGTSRADVLFGLDAGDALNGLGGNDLLCAGKGMDALNGGNGNDTLFGGPGKDTITGGSGDDGLFGGGGDDLLSGDNGADTLGGGAGPDSFSGGAGEDVATDFHAGEGDTKDASIP